MESEDVSHTPALELPESVAQWLDETADGVGLSRERLLTELLAAHRTLHEEDIADERLDELHDEFVEKLTDVRERVVQIKRESDGKAPADHDHVELRDELDELRTAVDDGDAFAEELGTLDERVTENRERLESGFENYENVLEYLTETTDELDDRLDVLARALVSVRDQARTLAARNAMRAATAELAKSANRHGITSADCGGCASSVTIALLTEPTCPHCEATFEDVEPKQGFFGSNRLVVGRSPALEGDTVDTDVDDLSKGATDE